MIKTISLTAERRDTRGKGPARQMRMGGRIPATVYGRTRNAEALSLLATDIEQIISGGATASTVLSLEVGGKSENVLMREIQRHPVRQHVMHVDFYAIRAGETITVDVPIHLEGIPNGVRNSGGTLDQVLREITISVLPRYIPERINLDVLELEIGQSLHVRDLEVENVKIMTDSEATVCTVIAPRVEEEVVPAEGEIEEEVEGEEPELIRKAKGEEDEAEEAEG